MKKHYQTPVKSNREKCLDCCTGQIKEVRQCTAVDCPLYPYRMGKRPDQATLDTLEEYFCEKVEHTKGF